MAALDGSICFPITGRPNNIGPIVYNWRYFFIFMCACMRTFVAEFVPAC